MGRAQEILADNFVGAYPVGSLSPGLKRYSVMTLCRMLHTISTGAIVSKLATLQWTEDKLNSRWKNLVQQAERDRYFNFDASERPRPGSVERTLEFAEYAKEYTQQKMKIQA